MKRTTIFMPETLEAELRRFAKGQKQPVAWVVREAVSAYLASHERPFRLPLSMGIGDSGRSDISEREDLIFADLAPDDDRVRGLPRRSSDESSGAKSLPRRSSDESSGAKAGPRRRTRSARRGPRR